MRAMRLYDYWRSSAAYRVRIALNLKGLEAEQVPVHLARGEQRQEAYRGRNPQGLVPLLETDGEALTQSLAIIEYLEETHPPAALLPQKPADRAYVRSLALLVACDIHPINNLRILQKLEADFGAAEEQKTAWVHHWLREGLLAMEKQVADSGKAGKCCFGDSPTLADIALIPQLYNAHRFKCDIKECRKLLEIEAYCLSLPAFDRARPENQPDAVS